jgi:hypothetical protein
MADQLLSTTQIPKLMSKGSKAQIHKLSAT